MDCKKTSWGELLYSYSRKVATLKKTAVPLLDLTDLSDVIEPLPACLKTTSLVTECERRFPQLAVELAGEFRDEVPGADAAHHHPLYPLQARCQRSGTILLSIVKLCLSQGIFPAIFFSEFLNHLRTTGKGVRYGSGLFLESPGRLPCANLSPQFRKCCRKPAQYPCSRCQLVAYCSQDCRREHWILVHRFDCARAMQDSLQRDQQRMQEIRSSVMGWLERAHSAPMALWDRVPAFGVMGAVGGTPDLPSPFRVLLMDSYDLNNFIETLHQLDLGSVGEAQIFVQTPNGQALARNLILCSLLLRMASGELDDSAVDAVIAIWYSADLTPSQYLLLMDTIVQLLNTTPNTLPCHSFPPPPSVFLRDRHILDIQADMVNLTRKYGKEDVLLCGTMKQILCSGSSMSVRMRGLVLYKYLTQMGLSSLEPDAGSRQGVFGIYDRVDGIDGFLLSAHYSALEKFGQSGLLLPFAAQSFGNHHCLPNPTLVSAIDNPNVGWSAVAGRLEPLCGWPIHHVMDQVTSSNGIRHHGVPCNDIYGSLYFHVRDRILSAVAKIRACKIAFHFSDHQSRVQYLNDVITQGPGAGSIHIARADFLTDQDLGQSSSTPKENSLLENPLMQRVLVDGGAVIMLTKPADISERDMKTADLLFQKFVVPDNKFAKQLFELAQANKRGRNIIADLLLPQDAYVEEKMKELQKVREVWELQSVPSEATYQKPFMIYRTPLPTTKPKPAKVSLSEKQETTEAKAANKAAEQDDEPKQVWQGMLANISTPEECYIQVMLTCLDHSEMFLEVRKKASI